MKVWLVTGCSSGLGNALARRILAAGDALVATARRPDTLRHVVAQAPDRAIAVGLDVTDARSAQAAVGDALDRFGRLDVVVNNAGYGVAGALEELTDEQVRAQFDTNVFGVYNVLRATLPQLRRQGGGHVVNLSSIAGISASPALGAYAATKHAVEALSESLAREVAGFDITVTIVEPGAFRTNWAGGSMVFADQLPDYAGTAADRLRHGLQAINGRQEGDPDKAAAAIVAAVQSGRPPLRLPLGRDALTGIRAKADALAQLARDAAPVALSTSF